MQRAALFALVGEVKRDSLLQGLEKLVQRVAGGKAAWKLRHVGPAASFLVWMRAVSSIAESISS